MLWRVYDVPGIQAKKLIICVYITGINYDEKSDMIEFQVGVLSQKLLLEEF